jgi:hypothetical protein
VKHEVAHRTCKELAAAEEESQKVEGEAIQREKAAANELLRNVNQYLEQKKISNARASPRDKGVRLECGADHLEITATGQTGALQYKLETGDFGMNIPTNAVEEDTMLDATIHFLRTIHSSK